MTAGHATVAAYRRYSRTSAAAALLLTLAPDMAAAFQPGRSPRARPLASAVAEGNHRTAGAVRCLGSQPTAWSACAWKGADP